MMSVVVSGLIEGKLKFLHLNILNSFNFFHKVFMMLFGGFLGPMKDNYSHTVLMLPWQFICGWQFSVVLGTLAAFRIVYSKFTAEIGIIRAGLCG